MVNDMKQSTGISRRQFNRSALGAAVSSMSAPAFLRGQNLNSKLNIAVIGAGGRGGADTAAVDSENIVCAVRCECPFARRGGPQIPGG